MSFPYNKTVFFFFQENKSILSHRHSEQRSCVSSLLHKMLFFFLLNLYPELNDQIMIESLTHNTNTYTNHNGCHQAVKEIFWESGEIPIILEMKIRLFLEGKKKSQNFSSNKSMSHIRVLLYWDLPVCQVLVVQCSIVVWAALFSSTQHAPISAKQMMNLLCSSLCLNKQTERFNYETGSIE